MILNPIFTSNMVLAAGKPIRVFGTGCGHVSLSLNHVTKEVYVNNTSWVVELPPMECGGPYIFTIHLNDDEYILENIFIGYVYLFAGQSNMQFKLCESSTAPEEWKTEQLLHFYCTDRLQAGDTYTSIDGWLPCVRDSAGAYSAIAYLTGIEMVRRHSVAIGAISCYQGASVIESWVPPHLFDDNGIMIPLSEKHKDHTHLPFSSWNGDGMLYQYALSQVFPFSLSGVIWYQGESDTSFAEGAVYAEELGLMIDCWRKDFHDPELPFFIIQIADYLPRSDEGWKAVQKAQENICSMRNHVFSIISADVCENNVIHPPTKHILAIRIAELLSEVV